MFKEGQEITGQLSYQKVTTCACIHLLLLVLVYSFYGWNSSLKIIPSEWDLINMDAINYQSIKDTGYNYHENGQSLVAFFPGFPYLWKYIGLNVYGICILNILLFYTGFVFLAKIFAKDTRHVLIFLSLPPMMFMYVPYSEASFFLPSAMVLAGLYQKRTWMVMVGLFLCSVFRSTANIFLPAIIITELIVSDNSNRLKTLIMYLVPAVLGVFLVAWIQYLQTGHWFVFLTTQKYWGVSLRWPHIPFSTWGNMELLDGACLLTGIVISLLTAYIIYNGAFKKQYFTNKAIIFSMLYVSGLTAFTIAFKGGAIFSFNRYIVPTAFFFLAFNYLLNKANFSGKQIALAGLVIFIFWLPFFASWVHIMATTKFFLLTIYLTAYLLLSKPGTAGKLSFYGLYAVNLMIQSSLLYTFTSHHWVG